MGVRLTVDGMLLACELRPGEDGGPGFFSAAVLPTGSRETLEVWAFGDSAAAVELLRLHGEHGVGCPITVGVETRAKLSKNGAAILSTHLQSVVDEDGVVIAGRVTQAA